MAEQVSRRSFLEKTLLGVGALSSVAIAGTAGWSMANSDGESPAETAAAASTTSDSSMAATMTEHAGMADRCFRDYTGAFGR